MERSELNTGVFIIAMLFVIVINNWIVRAIFGSSVREYLIGLYTVVFVELVIYIASRLFLSAKRKNN